MEFEDVWNLRRAQLATCPQGCWTPGPQCLGATTEGLVKSIRQKVLDRYSPEQLTELKEKKVGHRFALLHMILDHPDELHIALSHHDRLFDEEKFKDLATEDPVVDPTKLFDGGDLFDQDWKTRHEMIHAKTTDIPPQQPQLFDTNSNKHYHRTPEQLQLWEDHSECQPGRACQSTKVQEALEAHNNMYLRNDKATRHALWTTIMEESKKCPANAIQST